MADRRDYYFRQKVTEAELDDGFEGLEAADFNLAVDHGLVGVVDGMDVSEKSGTPDLTVDVAGPGAAYSKQGERIAFSSLQNVDLSVDDSAVSTAVTTPGNSRVVSLFIEFDRLLSDPRIDGNSLTVYFQRDESFNFSVIQGAEATTGLEVPPALDPNKILLADVTLDFGQTQILNADISVTRREDAFRFTGTVPLVAGTAVDAVDALLAAFNNHLDAVANQHPAADVTYAGSGNWASGNPLTGSPATVEAAIDQVVADLARLTGGIGAGAAQIGLDALPNWHDATTQPATALQSRLTAIINALVATSGNGGADKLGVGAMGAWHDGNNIAAGSIYDTLTAIVANLAATAGLGGGDKIGLAAQGTFPDQVTAGSIYDQIGELLTRLESKATGIQVWDPALITGTLSGSRSVSLAKKPTTNDYVVCVDTSNGVLHSENPHMLPWTDQYGGTLGNPLESRAVIWSPTAGLFIVQPNAGVDEIITSPDGITWTIRNDPRAASTRYGQMDCVGLGIIIGFSSSTSGVISSPDGITWTARAYPGAWTGTARGGGTNGTNRFVITSSNDESAYSTNGTTWTNGGALPAPSIGEYKTVRHSSIGDTWIALAHNNNGNDQVVISQNGGVSWTGKGDPSPDVFHVFRDAVVLPDGTVVILAAAEAGTQGGFYLFVNDITAGDPYAPAAWTTFAFNAVEWPNSIHYEDGHLWVTGAVLGGVDPSVARSGIV